MRNTHGVIGLVMQDSGVVLGKFIEHSVNSSSKNSLEAVKHFGPALGVPHNHTTPYVCSIGRKFENARGRRKRCGFKVFKVSLPLNFIPEFCCRNRNFG
ncbi:unnamed protein product [Arabis nemorensis]|uniref:Large ribosomal subunit protein uL15/eL18 domain-containing protein n=1 Tax=Arabis nemorensis TaxID=586526 RepID=A0A565ATP8_9BRAS|nr:unnamed protein product [Arabis nemorensis]